MSSGRGRELGSGLYVAAYVLPAVAVWGMISIVLWPLGSIPGLISLAAWVYALGYGIVETVGLPIWRPSVPWQVPASWVAGRAPHVQALIWGATLGPGLLTRNPYAGMWLLPLLVAMRHSVLMALITGIAVGAAHGGARALGVLSNQRHLDARFAPMAAIGWQWRWQLIDGMALLLAAGALTVYVPPLFGIHL